MDQHILYISFQKHQQTFRLHQKQENENDDSPVTDQWMHKEREQKRHWFFSFRSKEMKDAVLSHLWSQSEYHQRSIKESIRMHILPKEAFNWELPPLPILKTVEKFRIPSNIEAVLQVISCITYFKRDSILQMVSLQYYIVATLEAGLPWSRSVCYHPPIEMTLIDNQQQIQQHHHDPCTQFVLHQALTPVWRIHWMSASEMTIFQNHEKYTSLQLIKLPRVFSHPR